MNSKELIKNFLRARRVISEIFGEAWLNSSTENELQKLWNRMDWIANTELLIFGDCLEKCVQINKDRAMYLAGKVKSSDLNQRKGAIYEIFIAGAYYNEGSSIVEFPTDPDNPGYDLKLTQNGFDIYISVKNYGLFERVEKFIEKSKQIRDLIKQNLQVGSNTVFVINDRSFPDVLEWRSLRENLPQMLNSDSKKTDDDNWAMPIDGGWSISVKYATGNEPDSMKNIALPGPICSDKKSYILFLFAKLHKNDLKTLFEKIFDKACQNLEDYGKDDQKSINIVFLRVPREINLESCKQGSIDYFNSRTNSKVSGIFLYQPEIVNVKDKLGGESLTHCYEFIINPFRGAVLNSGAIKFKPKFIIGLWNKGSAPIMFVTGKNNVVSEDTEYFKYQSGHIYYRPTKEKSYPEMVNGILMEPCGVSIAIDEKSTIRWELIPENYDLLLF